MGTQQEESDVLTQDQNTRQGGQDKPAFLLHRKQATKARFFCVCFLLSEIHPGPRQKVHGDPSRRQQVRKPSQSCQAVTRSTPGTVTKLSKDPRTLATVTRLTEGPATRQRRTQTQAGPAQAVRKDHTRPYNARQGVRASETATTAPAIFKGIRTPPEHADKASEHQTAMETPQAVRTRTNRHNGGTQAHTSPYKPTEDTGRTLITRSGDASRENGHKRPRHDTGTYIQNIDAQRLRTRPGGAKTDTANVSKSIEQAAKTAREHLQICQTDHEKQRKPPKTAPQKANAANIHPIEKTALKRPYLTANRPQWRSAAHAEQT